MKYLIAIAALLVASAAHAGTAFFERDYVEGMSRICIYNYMGSPYVITVGVHQLCPLTIQV